MPGTEFCPADQCAAGELGHDYFSRSAGFQIAILVRKAHDGIRVPNVDVLRIGPGRIKRDSVGQAQAGREYFRQHGKQVRITKGNERIQRLQSRGFRLVVNSESRANCGGIDLGKAEPGRQLEIEGRGAPSKVEIAALPFYRGSVRQAARA